MTTPPDLEPMAPDGAADAQFAHAAELLERSNDPGAFLNGTALVEQAAANGHAEATCMLATLEAIGAGRTQDWRRALDFLQLAAERGSEHARSQLRLLSAASSEDWRGMRGLLDIARLLRVSQREPLSERPYMRVTANFATEAECRWVIGRVRHKLGPAMVWDEASGMGKLDPSRSSSAVELRLTDMDVVTEVLRARISIATHLPEAIFETPQVMHYTVGQEFKPHHDFLDLDQQGPAADVARRGQRIGTFLIFLNDEFEGGETEFPKAGIAYRGGTGDALFFANVTPDGAPDPLTLHAGRPPTKGEKWIFSQWIRDRLPAQPTSAAR